MRLWSMQMSLVPVFMSACVVLVKYWRVSERSVNTLCSGGRLCGVVRATWRKIKRWQPGPCFQAPHSICNSNTRTRYAAELQYTFKKWWQTSKPSSGQTGLRRPTLLLIRLLISPQSGWEVRVVCVTPPVLFYRLGACEFSTCNDCQAYRGGEVRKAWQVPTVFQRKDLKHTYWSWISEFTAQAV